MIALPRPSPARAAGILRDVFGHLALPIAFRLWDGREVRLGPTEPQCFAVIKTPETFLRLVRNPTPYNFAEAFVDGGIDLEGDLYAAMHAANAVEELKLSPLRKLCLLLSLWRG